MDLDIEIDDEEAIQLIRVLAERLGVDEEEAVGSAVAEQLERLKSSAGVKTPGEPD
jgi:hypothetical protein